MVRLPASAVPPPGDDQPGEQLRWLGRCGRRSDLEAALAQLRVSPAWDTALALDASLAWLLLGDGRAADHAVLEADRLSPQLGLVPDPWGLWPRRESTSPAPAPGDAGGLAERLGRFQLWRWLDPLPLWQHWSAQLRADWTTALSPDGLDALALLLRHEAALEEPLESFLIALVNEAAQAAQPAQALQFWGFLCEVRPAWGYARLKAADLALGRGELEHAGQWLSGASDDDRHNPWHWDVAARHALAGGAVDTALEHWGEAIRRADAELAELFRQRRREARRGPGLLQARALLNRGDTAAALELLQLLVEQDPQWQPLRALLAQAEAATPAAPAAACPAGQAVLGEHSFDGNHASQWRDLDRFAALLERAAARHQISLPPPAAAADAPQATGTSTAADQLERFSAALAAAEARFALVA